MDGMSDMVEGALILKEQFNDDTKTVVKQTDLFVKTMHPAHLLSSKEEVRALAYSNSDIILDTFTFYRLLSCTTEDMENLQDFFNEKMKSFFCAVHSFGKPIIYGVVSCQGVTNLVIGIYGEQDRAESVKSVIEGLLDGIELCLYKPFFSKRSNTGKNVGFISAVPSVRISDDKQKFDISSLMKSLNGQDLRCFLSPDLYRSRKSPNCLMR